MPYGYMYLTQTIGRYIPRGIVWSGVYSALLPPYNVFVINDTAFAYKVLKRVARQLALIVTH